MSVASLVGYSAAHQALLEEDSERNRLFLGQEFIEQEARQWWVFYTKSRQEKALTHYLRARCIPHYLPLHKKQTLSRGRRLCSVVPLFSGYLFLFADDYERVRALESNRVARTLDVPPCRQEEFWRDLLQIQRLIESDVPLTIESRIQPGQRVRVKSGSLAGLEGNVTKRRGGWRLLIAVNYLQQGASVEIDDFAVEII